MSFRRKTKLVQVKQITRRKVGKQLWCGFEDAEGDTYLRKCRTIHDQNHLADYFSKKYDKVVCVIYRQTWAETVYKMFQADKVNPERISKVLIDTENFSDQTAFAVDASTGKVFNTYALTLRQRA